MPEIEFRDSDSTMLGRLIDTTLHIYRLTAPPVLGCACWLSFNSQPGNACEGCGQIRMLGIKIKKVIIDPDGCKEEWLEAVKLACRKTDVDCYLLQKVEA